MVRLKPTTFWVLSALEDMAIATFVINGAAIFGFELTKKLKYEFVDLSYIERPFC